MRIVFAGIMGRYPYGGVAWCSLMYLLGLRALGHEVWYLEDTGECNFDPEANTLAMRPIYAIDFIRSTLGPYELDERWCYIDVHGQYHGIGRTAWLEICGSADLYLNLSGGSWFWRDEYARIPYSAFIDSDPAFTQIDIQKRGPSHAAFFERFTKLFTFGQNIGTERCAVPTGGLQWLHTFQPVFMDAWSPSEDAARRVFTTIMTWEIDSFRDIGGNKSAEFSKILDLPATSPVALELAVNGPIDYLRSHGWRCVDAFGVSSDIHRYRDYVRGSMGELSVAKHTYVRTNSGWFSDRTQCYLASGRPCVVQDTGFRSRLPAGLGLFAFANAGDARDALSQLLGDYRRHSRAARELAASYFASEVVLESLIRATTASA